MIIIATAINDIHAIAVESALKRIGESCFRWVMTDYPTAQFGSVMYDGPDNFGICLGGNQLSREVLSDSILWNRRPSYNTQMYKDLHPDDVKVAESENRSFLTNMLSIINELTSCSINDLYKSEKAKNKTLQIAMAQRIGFTIPTTLISNNPILINDFISSGDVLAKSFRTHIWKGGASDCVNYSSLLKKDLMPSDIMLQACPMIFQKYINKKYEVRVNYFNGVCISVRLHSQQNVNSKVDWRSVSPFNLDVEMVSIPKLIENQCCELMNKLELIFGCIDMIVTPDDEWIFLEVNQMGQFLWIEEVNPDIPMLDYFIQFLLSPYTPISLSKKYNMDFLTLQEEIEEVANFEKNTRIKRPAKSIN